jgi:RHS repeat-associated protein
MSISLLMRYRHDGYERLRYGAGHVHGLLHGQDALIDFERDSLHREVQRTLYATQAQHNLKLTRERDSLGRLHSAGLQGLQPDNSIAAALTGPIVRRQYRYDNLSQLTTVQTPEQIDSYSYDGAGRLREQATYDPEQYLRAPAGQAKPQATQRWDIDPAGNRLPSKLTDEREQRQSWAEMVHKRWQDPKFNLLRQDPKQKGPPKQWMDNRIGYFEDHALRYDLMGNRTEQLGMKQDDKGQYTRQRYGWDGSHRLTEVKVAAIVGRGQVVQTTECRYVHDALGRRLKKIIKDPDGKEHITYFGWDGDQLVHIETLNDDGTRDIQNIVYEPDSFTPLVRLSTTVKGQTKAQSHFVVQAVQAGLKPEKKNNPQMQAALGRLQQALAKQPGEVQKAIESNLRQALEQAQPGQRISGLEPCLSDTQIVDMRQGLQEQKQEQHPVAIHFFHCDHLGTPIGLTDRQGQIVWAAKRDPFGNLLEEYNPNGIEQDIALPGQYHDRETDLHYNRHRYYDPKIGAYISQDPVGLAGGWNNYSYVDSNPISNIDPIGLAYFAYRPLAGSPWLGPFSDNPVDNALGTSISHEQLFFEDGKNPSNIGFFGDNTIKTEPNPQGYHIIPGKYNDCVIRKAVQNVKLKPYHLFGNNCQNWAHEVQDEYKKLLKDPATTKACNIQ